MKWLAFVLVSWQLLFCGIEGAAAPQPILVTVDGEVLPLDEPPVVVQGRVMVPLRGVFEGLGATVTYDPVAHTIFALRGNTEVTLTLGTDRALVNGQEQILDAPPVVMGNRILVPLRFVIESMGAEVKWTANTRTVDISSRTGGGLGVTPRIESVTHNATAALRSGDTVTVSVIGDPGGSASFDITGVTAGVPMMETSPGRYVGSYNIEPGLSASNAYVVAHLRVAGEESIVGDMHPLSIYAEMPSGPEIQVRPLPGTVVRMLRPRVEVFFPTEIESESMHFSFDGVEITQQLRVGQKLIEWVPQENLSTGEHRLEVHGRTTSGTQFRREWNFYVSGDMG